MFQYRQRFREWWRRSISPNYVIKSATFWLRGLWGLPMLEMRSPITMGYCPRKRVSSSSSSYRCSKVGVVVMCRCLGSVVCQWWPRRSPRSARGNAPPLCFIPVIGPVRLLTLPPAHFLPPLWSSEGTPRLIPACCDNKHFRRYWYQSVYSGRSRRSVLPGWPAQDRTPGRRVCWDSQGKVPVAGNPSSWCLWCHVEAVPDMGYLFFRWDKWWSWSVPSKICLISNYVASADGMGWFRSLLNFTLAEVQWRDHSILVVHLVTVDGRWGWYPRSFPVRR